MSKKFRGSARENKDGTIRVIYPVDENSPESPFGTRAPLMVEWLTPDDVGPIMVATKVEIEKFMLGKIKAK